MILRKVILFLLFITSGYMYSQNTIVRYVNYKKIDDQKYISFLIFNNTKSIEIESYIDPYNTFQDLINDKKFVEDKKFIRNIKKDSIFSNTFYGVTTIPSKGYAIYKDVIEKINWKLHDSIVNILGFKCHKATSEFRGRNYTAWYTTDIPAPLGPWKLGGLPGLILKIDSDDEKYTFEATSIIFNSPLKVPEKYYSFYSDNSKNIIPYKTFIKYENIYWEQVRKEQIANLPKGVVLTDTPPIRDTFIERSFEWDNTKTNSKL